MCKLTGLVLNDSVSPVSGSTGLGTEGVVSLKPKEISETWKEEDISETVL